MVACLQVWLLNFEQNKIPRKPKRGNQLRDLTALFKSLIPRRSRISFSDKLFRSQITCYIFNRIRSTWALACTSSKLDMPAETSDSDFTVRLKKRWKFSRHIEHLLNCEHAPLGVDEKWRPMESESYSALSTHPARWSLCWFSLCISQPRKDSWVQVHKC